VPEVVTSRDDHRATTSRVEPWAWGICWLMFVSTVLNYMDRQTISLVNPLIRQEFHLSQESFGWVLAAFYLTYALFQAPAGYLTDRWNVRWTYAGAVAWWSTAGVAAAFAPSLGVLMIFRALLGIGESFNWPCALRVTATILPPKDRSLGNGIFNSGAAIGAVITPLVVPLMAKAFGWRVAFAVIGLLGFVWVGVWLYALRGDRGQIFAGRVFKPESSDEWTAPGISQKGQIAFLAALAIAVLSGIIGFRLYGLAAIWWAIALVFTGPLLIARLLPLEALKGADWAKSLGEVVRMGRFWILVVVSVSINVCWHFLVNWMGSFFQEERKLGLVAGGMVAAIPFLAADFGNLAGGALSRVFIARGLSPRSGRIAVVATGALLLSGGVLVGRLRSEASIIVVVSLMALGAAAYMANYFAFTQDVSSRHTGLVVGILGGLGNLFAAGFMPITGMIKDRTGGFGGSFVIVGLLPWVGVAALALGWRTTEEGKPS
jgi:MFS transporter, ACS family, hexuronate transporter